MSRYVRATLFLTLALAPSLTHAADICATSFDDLAQTERLRSVQQLFQGHSRLGLVNETKGSYLVMENLDGKLLVTFYTSGVFDLYAVKKEGALIFCDTGSSLILIGLDHREDLQVSPSGILQIGSGGPRMLFHAGNMPAPLKAMHHIVERGIASDP